MAIGVEGERDGAVAEEFLDHLGMDIAIEQMGGSSVPEVVDTNSRERSLIDGSMKPLSVLKGRLWGRFRRMTLDCLSDSKQGRAR